MSRAIPAVFTGLILSIQLAAQTPEPALTRLRKSGVPEAPGSVPVLYPPEAKERALALQQSIEAAHAWFQKQLGIQVPVVLVLLDSAMQETISDHNPIPHNRPSKVVPGMILIPPPLGLSKPRPGMDRDHVPGGKLAGEHVLFHEDGHLIANTLKFLQASPFVNELIANIFCVAYIRSQRPDLKWVLESELDLSAPPRYTSLFDLENAGGGNPANYFWYQGKLERLADFLTKDQDFRTLVEKLEKVFPAGPYPGLEAIIARLEAIRPGFAKELGPLAGPSTLLRIAPAACQEPTNETRESLIVIQNDTDSLLDVTHPDGHKLTVDAHRLRPVRLPIGSSIRLPDDTCLRVRDEPSLAVFKKQ
jgi:hypothetical protein